MKNPLIIAHRGASGYAPENTLASFKKAVEMGCDGIELDVHLSKDGNVIVCHDESVDRTTNGTGLIKDLNLEDLKKLDAGSWFGNEFSKEKIPTLNKVIEYTKNNDILINIELKNGIINYYGLEEKVIDIIRKYDIVERVIVSSFNHRSLVKIKKLYKFIKTGVLYINNLSNPWEYAKNIRADALHPEFNNITKEFVNKCTEKEMIINTYTVNKERDIERIGKFKPFGIITNFPDKARYIMEKL